MKNKNGSSKISWQTTGFNCGEVLNCMECGAQYTVDDVEYISFCSTTCYWKYRQKHDLKKYTYTDEELEEIIKRINKFKKERGL